MEERGGGGRRLPGWSSHTVLTPISRRPPDTLTLHTQAERNTDTQTHTWVFTVSDCRVNKGGSCSLWLKGSQVKQEEPRYRSTSDGGRRKWNLRGIKQTLNKSSFENKIHHRQKEDEDKTGRTQVGPNVQSPQVAVCCANRSSIPPPEGFGEHILTSS